MCTLSVKQNPAKGELLAAQLLRYSLTVCGLSEIRWQGTGQKQLGAYAVHYSEVTAGPAQHGVLIALSQPPNVSFIATLSASASSQPLSTQPSRRSQLCKSTRQLILQPLRSRMPFTHSYSNSLRPSLKQTCSCPCSCSCFNAKLGCQAEQWGGAIGRLGLQHQSLTMASDFWPCAWLTVWWSRTPCFSTLMLSKLQLKFRKLKKHTPHPRFQPAPLHTCGLEASRAGIPPFSNPCQLHSHFITTSQSLTWSTARMPCTAPSCSPVMRSYANTQAQDSLDLTVHYAEAPTVASLAGQPNPGNEGLVQSNQQSQPTGRSCRLPAALVITAGPGAEQHAQRRSPLSIQMPQPAQQTQGSAQQNTS